MKRDGIHNQRIALPTRDRFSQIGWLPIVGMRTAVGGNDSKGVMHFVKNDDLPRKLDNLERQRSSRDAWHARDEAAVCDCAR